jgi:serine/threonine-protein kinase
MATVYDAIDERLERTVAVKVMHPSYAADPLFIDRFMREAKATAGLNHPNVVAVFDQGSHDGLAFLVMEQVHGLTLRDVLARRGRLSVPEAVSVLESVLHALAAAHRNGLVHRDVKPENVLISSDGAVKVADFGLARAVEGSTHTATGGVVMGTVAYVSPEQIITGQADTRSDVYSAGVMLFELLTGTVPFGGDSAMNIAFQHVNNDVPSPAQRAGGIPPALDELVVRATRREPGARPADAGAFLAELSLVRADLRLPHVAVTAPVSDQTAVFSQTPTPTRMVPRSLPPRTAMQPAANRMAGGPPAGPPVGPPAPRRPRGRRGAVIATGVVLCLGLAAIFGGWWLGTGRFSTAPALLNLPQAQAAAKAQTAGFAVRFAPPEFNEAVQPGLVLRQDPEPSAKIANEGTITLVISRGPERFAVPPVTGRTAAKAQELLSQRQLRVDVKPVFSDSVGEGQAVGTDPKAGTALPRDSLVTLFVSKGSNTVELPDLQGQSRDDAVKAVTDLGLNPEVTEQQTDDSDEVGKVISQDPGAGNIRPSSTVRLVIGVDGQNQGDEQIEVPDVTGESFKNARNELRDRGLDARKIGNGDRVFAQFPGPGSRVKKGTKINLAVAGNGNN